MAPRDLDIPPVMSLEDDDTMTEIQAVITPETHQQKQPPLQIVWTNVIWMSVLHLGAVYGLFLIPQAHPLTWLWSKYTKRCMLRFYYKTIGLTNCCWTWGDWIQEYLSFTLWTQSLKESIWSELNKAGKYKKCTAGLIVQIQCA